MLWRVKIPPRKKLILISIFSVTVVVMTVSVIRVAIIHKADKNTDISLLYVWSNIELVTCQCWRVLIV